MTSGACSVRRSPTTGPAWAPKPYRSCRHWPPGATPGWPRKRRTPASLLEGATGQELVRAAADSADPVVRVAAAAAARTLPAESASDHPSPPRRQEPAHAADPWERCGRQTHPLQRVAPHRDHHGLETRHEHGGGNRMEDTGPPVDSGCRVGHDGADAQGGDQQPQQDRAPALPREPADLQAHRDDPDVERQRNRGRQPLRELRLPRAILMVHSAPCWSRTVREGSG
jgi:hypothetical protein